MLTVASMREEVSTSSTTSDVPVHLLRDAPTQLTPVLTISGGATLKYLILTTGILLALNLVVVLSYQFDFVFPKWDKFYFDREGNLPTYFSSFLLLTAAVMLSFIAALKRGSQDFFSLHWAVLALVFLGLSVDESISFHEMLIEPLRKAYHLSGFLRFPWVLAGGVFVGIFGVGYIKFFLALSPLMKRLFFTSAATYIGGALGLEMLGGYLFIGFEDFSVTSLPYMVVMTLEETLEMSGVLLFIYTLLRYIKTYTPHLTVSFKQ